MDDLNIHRKKSLTDHLGPAQADYLWNRLRVHYTPKHGSWLNQAEIELSLISRQCLGKRRIPTLERLQSETRAWIKRPITSVCVASGTSRERTPARSTAI